MTLTVRGRPLDLLAALEVAGRHALRNVPSLRARVGRWARRPAQAPQAQVSLEQLKSALEALGGGELKGHDLMVHSAWEGLKPLAAKPSQVISLLRELIGPEATLLMPSHQPADKPGEPRRYDPKRMPSSLGLLTESFRRTPGVRRSPFPVAPVCALGPAAELYTGDFRERSKLTPYGPGSSWALLGERGAKVMFLGVDFIRANSLVHAAFDLIGDHNPIAGYYEERTYQVVLEGGPQSWSVRCQRPSLEPYYASQTFKRLMLAEGLVRRSEVGGISLGLLDAKRFLDWHCALARETGLPYWGFKRR